MNYTVNHWQIKPHGQGSSAEDIWNAACRYFMWCESNPVYRGELLRAGSLAGSVVDVPVVRPFTWTGLCLHCGITYQYLREMAKNVENEDYYLVAQRIMMVIATQNLENAMAGVYNSPFVAKLQRVGEDLVMGKSAPQISVNVITGNAPPLLTSEQDFKGENPKGESGK